MELNSKSLIDILSRSFIHKINSSRIVQVIFALMDCDWHLKLNHTPREANFCADILANHGLNLEIGTFIWNSPPDFLNLKLLSNAIGIYVPPRFQLLVSFFSWLSNLLFLPKKKSTLIIRLPFQVRRWNILESIPHVQLNSLLELFKNFYFNSKLMFNL